MFRSQHINFNLIELAKILPELLGSECPREQRPKVFFIGDKPCKALSDKPSKTVHKTQTVEHIAPKLCVP